MSKKELIIKINKRIEVAKKLLIKQIKEIKTQNQLNMFLLICGRTWVDVELYKLKKEGVK